MSFKKAGRLPGKIFVPEDNGFKKHPCPDCQCCQWCTDERCAICLKRRKCKRSK